MSGKQRKLIVRALEDEDVGRCVFFFFLSLSSLPPPHFTILKTCQELTSMALCNKGEGKKPKTAQEGNLQKLVPRDCVQNGFPVGRQRFFPRVLWPFLVVPFKGILVQPRIHLISEDFRDWLV